MLTHIQPQISSIFAVSSEAYIFFLISPSLSTMLKAFVCTAYFPLTLTSHGCHSKQKLTFSKVKQKYFIVKTSKHDI